MVNPLGEFLDNVKEYGLLSALGMDAEQTFYDVKSVIAPAAIAAGLAIATPAFADGDADKKPAPAGNLVISGDCNPDEEGYVISEGGDKKYKAVCRPRGKGKKSCITQYDGHGMCVSESLAASLGMTDHTAGLCPGAEDVQCYDATDVPNLFDRVKALEGREISDVELSALHIMGKQCEADLIRLGVEYDAVEAAESGLRTAERNLAKYVMNGVFAEVGGIQREIATEARKKEEAEARKAAAQVGTEAARPSLAQLQMDSQKFMLLSMSEDGKVTAKHHPNAEGVFEALEPGIYTPFLENGLNNFELVFADVDNDGVDDRGAPFNLPAGYEGTVNVKTKYKPVEGGVAVGRQTAVQSRDYTIKIKGSKPVEQQAPAKVKPTPISLEALMNMAEAAGMRLDSTEVRALADAVESAKAEYEEAVGVYNDDRAAVMDPTKGCGYQTRAAPEAKLSDDAGLFVLMGEEQCRDDRVRLQGKFDNIRALETQVREAEQAVLDYASSVKPTQIGEAPAGVVEQVRSWLRTGKIGFAGAAVDSERTRTLLGELDVKTGAYNTALQDWANDVAEVKSTLCGTQSHGPNLTESQRFVMRLGEIQCSEDRERIEGKIAVVQSYELGMKEAEVALVDYVVTNSSRLNARADHSDLKASVLLNSPLLAGDPAIDPARVETLKGRLDRARDRYRDGVQELNADVTSVREHGCNYQEPAKPKEKKFGKVFLELDGLSDSTALAEAGYIHNLSESFALGVYLSTPDLGSVSEEVSGESVVEGSNVRVTGGENVTNRGFGGGVRVQYEDLFLPGLNVVGKAGLHGSETEQIRNITVYGGSAPPMKESNEITPFTLGAGVEYCLLGNHLCVGVGTRYNTTTNDALVGVNVGGKYDIKK